MYLGATVDYEPGSISSSNANGDDNNFTGATMVDDEDGVVVVVVIENVDDLRLFDERYYCVVAL